jgi:hypothetical protein
MHVILSEAKDLTVGIRVYSNELKINEEKIIPHWFESIVHR